MNRPRIARLALVACAGAMLALPAFASFAPPSDAQLDEAFKKIADAGKGIEDRAAAAKARDEAVADAIKDIDLTQVNVAQAERFIGLFGKFDAVKSTLCSRLEALAKDTGPDGARAQELWLNCFAPPRATSREEFEKVMPAFYAEMAPRVAECLKHPGLPALLKSGKGEGLLGWIGRVGDQAKAADLVKLAEPLITTDLPPAATRSFRSLMSALNDEKVGVDKALKEKVRTRMVASVESAIATLGTPGDEKGVAQLKGLKSTLALAKGAWGRGDLIGGTAPEVTFTWSNSKEPIKSLADLKGKVVIVDFWATWCGPCIATFPNIRQLVARYEGYPVVVLGVTSLQGFHIKRTLEEGSKPERIDCKDDAAKEMGFMPDYLKDMNITWTVAFSDQEVFNPDFGVNGIPHVAIIDPAGKVRYNGLHPGGDANEKYKKIDDLLKEAKLPVPEPVASAAGK